MLEAAYDPKAEVAPNREPIGGAQKAGRQDHPIRVELQRCDLGRGEMGVAVAPALLQCLRCLSQAAPRPPLLSWPVNSKMAGKFENPRPVWIRPHKRSARQLASGSRRE